MLAVGGTLFGRRAKLLVDLVRLGKPVERFDDVPERVKNEAVIAGTISVRSPITA